MCRERNLEKIHFNLDPLFSTKLPYISYEFRFSACYTFYRLAKVGSTNGLFTSSDLHLWHRHWESPNKLYIDFWECINTSSVSSLRLFDVRPCFDNISSYNEELNCVTRKPMRPLSPVLMRLNWQHFYFTRNRLCVS